MAINEDLDPDFILKIDFILIIFPQKLLSFKDQSSLMKAPSQYWMKDAKWTQKMRIVWKCASFLTGKFSFLEWCYWRRSEDSWRRSEDKVGKIATFLIRGKIFSINWALLNLLFGLKDEWKCALDASADVTKADSTNEALVLFSFFLCLLVFLDDEVSTNSDEGWVSEVLSSLVPFGECLSS